MENKFWRPLHELNVKKIKIKNFGGIWLKLQLFLLFILSGWWVSEMSFVNITPRPQFCYLVRFHYVDWA